MGVDVQDPATPELALPPGLLAVVTIPKSDGGDSVIMVELAEEHPRLFGGILRGLRAVTEAA